MLHLRAHSVYFINEIKKNKIHSEFVLVIDDSLWDRRTEQSLSLNVVQVQCYTKEVVGKRAGI